MLAALSFQLMTTTGQYRVVLITALVLTALADVLLVIVTWRGRGVWRIAAVVAMMPTLFVVSDFMRRAHAVFP